MQRTLPCVGISIGLPNALEVETLPTPHHDDRKDGALSAEQTLSWVERFLSAAAEPTCPETIDAQREALSMLFPEARVAGISMIPPLKVGPDFPGSLGLLLVPDFLDYRETDLGAALRNLIDGPDWSGYANGLMRKTMAIGSVEAVCTLVIARAIDRKTLLQAASEGL